MSENLPTATPMGAIDVRNGLPEISVQKKQLAEYTERRNHFFKWLLSQFKEGIHYGFPPGCEAKYDEHGNMVNRKTLKSVPSSQWIPKPCLYKSGALLAIDLFKPKQEYFNDMEAWKMAGEPKGILFRRCAFTNWSNGEKIGEGTGSYKIGDKGGMDANASIKVCDKRAMVACCLNSYPLLGELFTQDIEDKLAERQKGNIGDRKRSLLAKISDNLADSGSEWDAEMWATKAVRSAFGPNAKLSSSSAVDAFEAFLDDGRFDIKTATLKPEK